MRPAPGAFSLKSRATKGSSRTLWINTAVLMLLPRTKSRRPLQGHLPPLRRLHQLHQPRHQLGSQRKLHLRHQPLEGHASRHVGLFAESPVRRSADDASTAAPPSRASASTPEQSAPGKSLVYARMDVYRLMLFRSTSTASACVLQLRSDASTVLIFSSAARPVPGSVAPPPPPPTRPSSK